MNGLLAGDIDAAEAMTYNEYAQVLEAENPETGELYTPDDLNVISYEEVGVGMLQDAIWADATRLADEAYADIATRFLAASIEGWAYCRDNPEACAETRRRRRLAARRQPPAVADERGQQAHLAVAETASASSTRTAWERTVEIAQNTANLEGATVLTGPAVRGRLHQRPASTAALELVGDVDTTGEDFEPHRGHPRARRRLTRVSDARYGAHRSRDPCVGRSAGRRTDHGSGLLGTAWRGAGRVLAVEVAQHLVQVGVRAAQVERDG